MLYIFVSIHFKYFKKSYYGSKFIISKKHNYTFMYHFHKRINESIKAIKRATYVIITNQLLLCINLSLQAQEENH